MESDTKLESCPWTPSCICYLHVTLHLSQVLLSFKAKTCKTLHVSKVTLVQEYPEETRLLPSALVYLPDEMSRFSVLAGGPEEAAGARSVPKQASEGQFPILPFTTQFTDGKST